MRWTALLVAVPLLLLASTASQPGPAQPAPPGADGEFSSPSVEVIDDRPAVDRTARRARAGDQSDDDGLLRRESQVRSESRQAGSSSGTDVEVAIDPGPDAEFLPAMVTDDGYEVVGGTAQAGAGERVAYTVEVDPRTDVDPLAATAAVERALHDPRSWAADVELMRVDDPADAQIRVVLATPAEVDRLCAEAGLKTAGRFSCWNGTVAALNAMRWARGAADFDDLDTYRTYLVNHEFGHGLGHGHVDCPGPHRTAPVMMQQTVSTAACTANGWPYPERSAD